MNNKEILLQKFANLIVKSGINVKQDQIVLIKAPIASVELVRHLVKEAYLNGALKVMIDWSDDETSKNEYEFAPVKGLTTIPGGVIERMHYLVDQNAALISITSPNPGLMKDLDPAKIQAVQRVYSKATTFFKEYTMSNKGQWCVVAYPNPSWAKRVFPDLPVAEAETALL